MEAFHKTVLLLALSLAVWASPAFSFHSDLSFECQVVLSDLTPRQNYTCAGATPAQPMTPAEIDALHGEGYFEYIWSHVLDSARRHGVSPGLIMATLMKESHFMPTAVSCYRGGGVAARGISQIIVKNAAGEQAVSDLSRWGDGRFRQMLAERKEQDPDFHLPPELEPLAKFQWVWGIDSHIIDTDIGIFEGACSTTDQAGNVRPCPSTQSGPGKGLRGFPGCFEALREKCYVGNNIRSNLFCPNYNIELAAVYVAHLYEKRQFHAEKNTDKGRLRLIIGEYNNANDAERFCHVHAIAGRGGGFGGTHLASYCSLENAYLHGGLSGARVQRPPGATQ